MGVPIHLIGLPTDVHSSYLRGPARAPAQIRAQLSSEHGNAGQRARHAKSGAEITLVDCGDLPLTEGPTTIG
jgi:arginase family enzyme